MRVALVNNFPPYSGTGKVAYELFKNLNDISLGDQVVADLYCTHVMRRSELSWPENHGAKFLHPFAYKEHENLSRLFIYFVDPYLIPRNYDLYHVTNHMLGRFAAVVRPAVATVHDVLQFKYREKMGNSISSAFYNFLMDRSIRSLRSARRLICVSRWSAVQVSQILEIDPARLTVVYNGLDHRLFYPRSRLESRRRFGLPDDAKIILNVGSEIKRKNLDLVFRSFKRLTLREPRVRLVRLGEKTAFYDGLIKDLSLDDSVFYFDKLKDDEVPCLYSACDVLVVPSYEEGFGFPIIEAQACGIPVIAANRSSLPEVVGPAGYFLDDLENDTALSDLIIEVLDLTKDRCQNLLEAGFVNAQRFSWEKNAREVLAVYEDVVCS